MLWRFFSFKAVAADLDGSSCNSQAMQQPYCNSREHSFCCITLGVRKTKKSRRHGDDENITVELSLSSGHVRLDLARHWPEKGEGILAKPNYYHNHHDAAG